MKTQKEIQDLLKTLSLPTNTRVLDGFKTKWNRDDTRQIVEHHINIYGYYMTKVDGKIAIFI